MSMVSPYSPFFISGLHSRHSSLPESVAPSSFLDSFIDDERSLYPRHSVASSDFLSLDLAAPPPELADRYSRATKRSSGLLPSSNNANIDRTRPPKNPPTAPLPASPTLTSSKPMSPPVPTLTLVASHTTIPEDLLHLVPGDDDDIMPISAAEVSQSRAADKRESTSTRNTSSTGRTVSTHYRTTKRDDALAALEGLRRMRSNDTLRFAKFKARAIAKAQRERERVAQGVNWISMSDDEDEDASFWRASTSSTSHLVSSWRVSSTSSRTASPDADTRRRRGTSCALDFDFDVDHTLGFDALCDDTDRTSAEDLPTPTPHVFARCESTVPPLRESTVLPAFTVLPSREDDRTSLDSMTSESDELDGFVVVTSPYFDQRASASDSGLVLAWSSNHLSPSYTYMDVPPSPARSAPTHRPNRSTPSFLRPPSLGFPGRKKALSISGGSKAPFAGSSKSPFHGSGKSPLSVSTKSPLSRSPLSASVESPATPRPSKKSKRGRSHHEKSSSADKAEKGSRKLKSFIDLRPAPRVAMGRSFVEVW
ncbi:hypothetical protein EV122DRAFT_285946 [Schizophyllum commune]